MKSIYYAGFLMLSLCGLLQAQQVEVVAQFSAADARQGVAVSADYVFAINSASITQYDKETFAELRQWQASAEEPILHLDSGVVVGDRLYAAHSNYPDLPMTSSVEIWDAETLEHVGSHSFGVLRGSFTWLDRHDGFWWGTFANYDKVQDGQSAAYGLTANTQIVKMDDDFRVLESWIIPQDILNRVRPMSNSGGSWGPDGLLYITGHDHLEVYVLEPPKAGSEMRWLATLPFGGFGQGIAWDRFSDERLLWGIVKSDRQMVVTRLSVPAVD